MPAICSNPNCPNYDSAHSDTHLQWCGECEFKLSAAAKPIRSTGTLEPAVCRSKPFIHEEPQEIVAGLQFSIVPKFELLPREGITRLIQRIEYGELTKGQNAWNASTSNQEALADKVALAKRLGHAIDHAYKLLDKLYGGSLLYDLKKNDDDAAALQWAGMYACCATKAIEDQRRPMRTNYDER